MCKKLIGKKGRKFWCKKCKEELQSVRQERLKQKKEIKICPECGIGIQSQSLVAHISQIHHAEKQICPHCSGVFANKHTVTGNLLMSIDNNTDKRKGISICLRMFSFQ